jgi:single-strand DNA-binding protein
VAHEWSFTVSQGLNKCQFIGNLGADPESRYMPSGDALSSFSVGVTETYKDKQTGEKKEITEWIRCSVWGRLAEVCNEYLKKGAKVYIEGKFKTRSYEKDGQTRYAVEIKVENMLMLGGGQRGEEGGGERRERTNAGTGSQRQPQERSGQKTGSAGKQTYGGGGGFDEMSDDIPFSPICRGIHWHSVA